MAQKKWFPLTSLPVCGISMGQAVIRKWLEPDLPAHLREEFVMLAADHLRSQSGLLLIGFIISLPMVILARVETAPTWIGIGLPLAILVQCLAGLALLRNRPLAPKRAHRFLYQGWLVCLGVAATGSLWAVLSWTFAPVETRVYYVAILSIGALTMGYTLTATRTIGSSALCVALLPISLALLTAGTLLDTAFAVGLLIATGFQIMLMDRQQRLMIELVDERRHSHQLARLDPLTGLANRRALLEESETLGKCGDPMRLMIIDIDTFKRVNDLYGHDTGDEVLMIVATIVARRARGDIVASRLGGEEFALLGPASDLDRGDADGILFEIRNAEMPHGEGLTASIGIATGRIAGVGDWSDLYATADRALYAAKRGGRNRVEEWQDEIRDRATRASA